MKDVESILLSPLWPTKPFIFVAMHQGLTSLSVTYHQSDLHHLEKDMKAVSKSLNCPQIIDPAQTSLN